MTKFKSKLSNKFKNGEIFKYIIWKLKINKIMNIKKYLVRFLNLITLPFRPFPNIYLSIKYMSLKLSPSDIHQQLENSIY